MQAAKKLSALICAVAMLLSGCNAGTTDIPTDASREPESSAPQQISDPETSPESEDSLSKIFFIAYGADTGELTLCDEGGEIYALSTDGMENVPDLTDGMIVEVFFEEIGETWPAQIYGATSVKLTDASADDRCGLYLQVLEDLWNEDYGLNSDDGLCYVGMDFSALNHLSSGEKNAIIWIFSSEHGLTPVEGTWDELCEKGYIDRENLYWEDGIFFSITSIDDNVWTTPMYYESSGTETPDHTAFNAEKWRSGLGAYFFEDCSARRDRNGVWSYTVGAVAIA